MTPVQKIELRMAEARRELQAAMDAETRDHDAMNALTSELGKLDTELIAAKLLEPENRETVTPREQSTPLGRQAHRALQQPSPAPVATPV